MLRRRPSWRFRLCGAIVGADNPSIVGFVDFHLHELTSVAVGEDLLQYSRQALVHRGCDSEVLQARGTFRWSPAKSKRWPTVADKLLVYLVACGGP